MRTFSYILCACLLVSCSTNQKEEKEPEGLPFDVTGSAEAIPSFQKGLLLLHNFEYDDAAEEFVNAQRKDPDFAMAYWGEAMSHNHPVWQTVDMERARTSLRKFGQTPAERMDKTKTKIEKDFIESIEILFGEGAKGDRDKAYADHMSKMYKEHKGNHEVAAFYALSLLGTKEGWGEMEEKNFDAQKISESILKENPSHPGALHYLVHSDDHPEYASNALTAAREYAKIASYAGHALHMPSHIYLALGMWGDVVNSNEVSWQASLDRKERKGLTNDDLNYHAYWWLQYGYLQQGRYEKAEGILANQKQFANELPSSLARFHLLMMKGHFLMETNSWTGGYSDLKVETKDLSADVRSIGRFVDGTIAFRRKNLVELGKIIGEGENDRRKVNQLKLEGGGIPVCGVTAYADRTPSLEELNQVEIFTLELKAMEAWLKNDLESVEGYFVQAVEKSKGYLVGPPRLLKPTQELFGEFLLSINRPKEAYDQFQAALKVSPGRILSLKGLLESSKQLGDNDRVMEFETKLREALKSGDLSI